MDHPFKVGDTVHHIFYGEGVVKELNCQNHVKDNERNILVHFPSVGLRQYSARELSFSPWPKADHERLEVWLCQWNTSREVLIRGFTRGKVFRVTPDYRICSLVSDHPEYFIKIKQLK
jgi:hypothetical protein